jgi:hypothetical protein
MSKYDPTFYKTIHNAANNPEIDALVIQLHGTAQDNPKYIAILENILTKIDNPAEIEIFTQLLQKTIDEQDEAKPRANQP